MRKFYSVIFIVLSLSLFTVSATAQTFSLVKDINPGTASAITSMPWDAYSSNGLTYFSAYDPIHGDQTWRSDGTEAGTFILKDFTGISTSGIARYIININGVLYFTVYSGTGGKYWLYKSDGTDAGTVLVKEIIVGPIGQQTPYTIQPTNLTNVNGTLFFTAGTVANGVELWKSDGTEAGTVIVKDIVTGNGSSGPTELCNANGTLYFSATTTANGSEVWKSDGTAAGTVPVKDIIPGSAGSEARDFNYVNGTIIFFAKSGGSSWNLWKTDGTDAGTTLLSNVSAHSFATFFYAAPSKALIGNTFYFRGIDAQGSELWRTDGTIAGTYQVKDINPGSADGVASGMAVANGMLYFSGIDSEHGSELWKSDGTEAGTVMVKDINPGSGSGFPNSTGHILSINNKICFIANDGIHSQQPWKSDGTEAGTVMIQNIIPATGSPVRMTAAGSKFIISFQDDTYGREIFSAAIPNDAAPLPLTMLDIRARLAGNNGLVTWKTTHEENTSHFEIERSTDNKKYSVVGTVASHNMNGVHDYGFTDPNITLLKTPVVFYRLKLVDLNGKKSYSKTFAIGLSDEQPVVMLYPTPAHDAATLMLSLRRRESLTINVVDITGKVVSQKRVAGNEGSNFIQLETASLSPGTYTVMINGSTINSITKLLKQ